MKTLISSLVELSVWKAIKTFYYVSFLINNYKRVINKNINLIILIKKTVEKILS